MLENYINQKLKEKRILLMTHLVVGYPSLEDNWNMLVCMQEAGVDLVELQLPFTEPIADGPTFIHANQLALRHGIDWDKYFTFFKKAATKLNFPILFMGYYNSIFCMGHELFCKRLKSSGGKGFIIADLPVEQSIMLDKYGKTFELDHVQIITPNNSKLRMKQIVENASGFLYCVARKGVTGARTELDEELSNYIQRCRSITQLPLALGFGINAPTQIRNLHGLVDIAIIGTACLEMWELHGKDGYKEYLNSLIDSCI